jgi:hypothetical protein
LTFHLYIGLKVFSIFTRVRYAFKGQNFLPKAAFLEMGEGMHRFLISGPIFPHLHPHLGRGEGVNYRRWSRLGGHHAVIGQLIQGVVDFKGTERGLEP